MAWSRWRSSTPFLTKLSRANKSEGEGRSSIYSGHPASLWPMKQGDLRWCTLASAGWSRSAPRCKTTVSRTLKASLLRYNNNLPVASSALQLSMKAKQGCATQTIAERKDEQRIVKMVHATSYIWKLNVWTWLLIIDMGVMSVRRVYTEQSLHKSSVVLISRKPSFLRPSSQARMQAIGQHKHTQHPSRLSWAGKVSTGTMNVCMRAFLPSPLLPHKLHAASIDMRHFCEVEDWESGSWYLDDSVRTVIGLMPRTSNLSVLGLWQAVPWAIWHFGMAGMCGCGCEKAVAEQFALWSPVAPCSPTPIDATWSSFWVNFQNPWLFVIKRWDKYCLSLLYLAWISIKPLH